MKEAVRRGGREGGKGGLIKAESISPQWGIWAALQPFCLVALLGSLPLALSMLVGWPAGSLCPRAEMIVEYS